MCDVRIMVSCLWPLHFESTISFRHQVLTSVERKCMLSSISKRSRSPKRSQYSWICENVRKFCDDISKNWCRTGCLIRSICQTNRRQDVSRQTFPPSSYKGFRNKEIPHSKLSSLFPIRRFEDLGKLCIQHQIEREGKDPNPCHRGS